jgi:hypothetical protein
MRRSNDAGACRRSGATNRQGHAGTIAVATSFSIASTRARLPVSLSTMNGAPLTPAVITYRM